MYIIIDVQRWEYEKEDLISSKTVDSDSDEISSSDTDEEEAS